MDSEFEVLGYGISLILLNVGMYSAQSALVIVKFYTKFSTESVETRIIFGLILGAVRRKIKTKVSWICLVSSFFTTKLCGKTNFPIVLLSCLSVLNH